MDWDSSENEDSTKNIPSSNNNEEHLKVSKNPYRKTSELSVKEPNDHRRLSEGCLDRTDLDMEDDSRKINSRNEFTSKTSLDYNKPTRKESGSRKYSLDRTRKDSSYSKYSLDRYSEDRDSTYLKTSMDRLNAGSRRRMSVESCVFSNSIVPPELVLSSCVNSTQDLSYFDESPKKSVKSALPEIIASCAATSFHIIVGVTLAATASLTRKLESPDSDIKPTESEIEWIASIFVIVVPIASIFSSYIMERFGRLNAVKLSTIPSILSCALIALSTNVYMIIGGRLLMGVGAALGTNPAVVYITEITSPEYRGALVSAGPTLSSLGMMLGYLAGALLPWRTVSWINIAYCLIPVILIIVLKVPESPVWLISRQKTDKARLSLLYLAKFEDESVREKIVERQLKALLKDREEKMTLSAKGTSFGRKLAGLKKPTGYKPLIIMIILFTFQQYTGVYITTFYAVQYFEAAGSSMNPFHASILIGLTRFLMSAATFFLLKKFGRRPLCITSCIGMAVFMAISGYYSHQVKISGESSMVPVYAILLYVCFCMIGLLTLPWTMAAEVFPNEIRGLAHGLVIGSAHVVMFVSIKTYYEMSRFFGGHDGLQWFFAVMSLLAVIFVFFFLPETHQRSLWSIEQYFKKHTIYKDDDDEDEDIVDDKNKNSIRVNNYENNLKSEQLKPSDRKYSIRHVEIMAALPENLSEYDTLIRQAEEKRPSIHVQNADKDSKFGNYDLSKIEYIDKSVVELDRIPYA